MRKSQVLVVAVALFLCSAVAVQAQAVLRSLRFTGATAREGGAAELAGNVVLFKQIWRGHSGDRRSEVFRPARGRGHAPVLMRGDTMVE